jgi:hypothetical protein
MRDDIRPLCGEEEFTKLLAEMVADQAPRVFAVVQEYGERVDGRIAAWGIAFDDHAAVVDVGGAVLVSAQSAESALRRFHGGSDITPRLVWVPKP